MTMKKINEKDLNNINGGAVRFITPPAKKAELEGRLFTKNEPEAEKRPGIVENHVFKA